MFFVGSIINAISDEFSACQRAMTVEINFDDLMLVDRATWLQMQSFAED